MNPASTVGSLWDGLNPNLIATFYEVDHNGAPIGSTVLRAAIADDAQLDITLNWQSPFEQAGPESKAPTVMAMLQSGALQPLADKLGAGEMARDGGVEAARGRTGMTKLNSTQVFSGMPPLKIQATLLLRAWRDPEMEVEMPLDQLMQWALPRELAPEGTLLTGAMEYMRGEKTFLEAALPSLAPTLIGLIYKGRQYSVIWSGVCKNGKDRTHLAFADGSRDFWVDTAAIAARGGNVTARRTAAGGTCDECGEHRATTTGRDSSGITGRLCTRCARIPESHRSFA